MSYEELQKKLEASIRKDEAQQRAIRTKREEKQQIKKSGGGHAIARAIMSKDTDTGFDYGHNTQTSTSETIDERIAREQSSRCMGQAVCNSCGKSHGYCAELEEEKERIKMLPSGDGAPAAKRKGGMDWLKNEDLSKTAKEAKILGVRLDEEGQFGSRVNLKLALDGKIKFWGIPTKKSKSPNYRLLLDKFGADENDWVDQRILILLEKDDFSDQWFPRVDFPKAEKKPSGR